MFRTGARHQLPNPYVGLIHICRRKIPCYVILGIIGESTARAEETSYDALEENIGTNGIPETLYKSHMSALEPLRSYFHETLTFRAVQRSSGNKC